MTKTTKKRKLTKNDLKIFYAAYKMTIIELIIIRKYMKIQK